MKIFLIDGENGGEKQAIEMEGLIFVSDIRLGLPERCRQHYYRLITNNNILLNNNDYISRYNFHENDEIRGGYLESFIKEDDQVIVEIFLAGWAPFIGWVIMSTSQTIRAMKAILTRIEGNIINIFNGDGQQMEDNELVADIACNGYYRLIISCARPASKHLSFDESYKLYNLHKLRFQYPKSHLIYFAQFASNGIEEMTRYQLIYQMVRIREIILSNDAIDARLNENVSNFPFLIKSKFLFQQDISARLLEICYEYWMLVKHFYISEVWAAVGLYFGLCVWDLLGECSDSVRDHEGNADKLFSGIIIDALDRFVLFLSEFGELVKSSAKLWTDLFSLITLSGSDFDDLLDDDFSKETFCTVKSGGKNHQLVILSNPRTIAQAKQEIAVANKTSEQDLYVIDRQNHEEPTGNDRFCQGIIVEMMRSMENFDFLRDIGKGAFGTIGLHQEKISGNEFVIKQLNDVKCSLYRDAFIGAKLSQSSLLRYSEVIKGPDSIHLVMPYLSGGSLTEYIRNGCCLGEKDIFKISYQILTQINELHKLEIIHRDIKPDNIVFDGEGNPKLIDFGLARYTARLTNEDLYDKLAVYCPGTINYMAPELPRLKPYSNKIDIWSFGMVQVEMVTRKPPFHWAGLGRIIIELKRMKKHKFKPIVEISEGLHQFINSCLTVNPDERPSGDHLIGSQWIIDYSHMCKCAN